MIVEALAVYFGEIVNSQYIEPADKLTNWKDFINNRKN